MKRLPKKPSDIIDVALLDLEKAERNKRYVVDMLQFHSPSREARNKCEVCLAGAVMAFSLDVDPTNDLAPSDFPPSLAKKLSALSHFTFGCVGAGLKTLGFKRPRGIDECRDVVSYRRDPTAYKADMKLLADDLRACSL